MHNLFCEMANKYLISSIPINNKVYGDSTQHVIRATCTIPTAQHKQLVGFDRRTGSIVAYFGECNIETVRESQRECQRLSKLNESIQRSH